MKNKEKLTINDKITEKILHHLSENARQSWAELGKKVHLTPQAVAVRVQKLQENGIIGKFTITQPKRQLHFISMFLASPNFNEFERAVTSHPLTESLYKISGKGCYHLQITCEDNTELDEFLTFLLQFGHYSLSSSIRQVL